MAAYLVVVRDARREIDTAAIVTRTYAWAAVVLVAGAVAVHQPPPAFDNVPAWGGIVAMALISQLLGHTAINASLRWFAPSTVSFTNLLEPVCAAALALIVFGEKLSTGRACRRSRVARGHCGRFARRLAEPTGSIGPYRTEGIGRGQGMVAKR